MKKYLKYLKNHYVAYLLILVIGFLSSFVTCYFINNVRAYYEASFIVENIESFDDSKLVDNDFLNEIKALELDLTNCWKPTSYVVSEIVKMLINGPINVGKSPKKKQQKDIMTYIIP